MDPETKQLVAFLTESAQEGKEFVLAQAPDVAQEIVLYDRIWSTTTCIALVVVIVIAILLIIGSEKEMKGKSKEDLTFYEMMWFFSVIASATSFIITITVVAPWLTKSWFCPNLVILDYLTSIL